MDKYPIPKKNNSTPMGNLELNDTISRDDLTSFFLPLHDRKILYDEP